MKAERRCKLLAQLSLLFVFVLVDTSVAIAQETAPNAALSTKAATVTAIPSSSNDPVTEQVPGGTGWVALPIFKTGNFTDAIAIGDGRNDGTVRLYATDLLPPRTTLLEFTFNGFWGNTSHIDVPFYSESALLTDGRGDGIQRLYVAEFNSGGNVSEFTWDGASWTPLAMPAAGRQLLSAAAGDARGDGSPHLYFSTCCAPPNNASYEYTFNGAGFDSATIPSPFTAGWRGIAVADGRNDGVLRVYQGVFDVIFQQSYLYEFSWNGASWDASRLNSASLVMGVIVGNGQNDGINRVYVVESDFGVREFTYNGSGWDETSDIAIGASVSFGVAIGDGQNDGMNRLYTALFNPGGVMEATFDGATWQTALVADLGGFVLQVSVGDARGDGVNRLYSSGANGVVEFTHQ